MFLTKEEKERRVIDLYSQGKTYRQIAEEVRISPNDIHAILKKKEEEEKNNNAVTNNQKQRQELSSRAYELFSKGKTSVEVAIALNLTEPKVSKMYRGYWKLRRLDKLIIIHKETNGKIWPVWKLYQRLVKKNGMNIAQVVNVVEIAIHKLPYMETLYRQIKDEVNKLHYTRQGLINDIEARKHKISILDKIAFSSEQECKRTEQRVQELTAKKDRLEKLIANILNDEDYSKLKQVAKENVKGALAENRKLISISFVALIQTLKADPEMIKLMYNIPMANDGEQHKDNNNITKYLEHNKNSLIDLAEKNYENLVEALTNNAIDSATAASSNPTLSLPSSSSIISSRSNKSHTYRIEEPENYHNSKGNNVYKGEE
jgi:DNA-binding CsgD family transcriptional regulator